MNLYQINFDHYSQKDSERGIYTFLVAEDEESVYEWIKSEPKVKDNMLFNSYKYNEQDGKEYEIYDDKWNVVGIESFRERMLRLGGEMYDDSVELDDLYYGKTLIGWELIKEDVLPHEWEMIQSLNIPIEVLIK